jgi:hypothetical protein
MVSLVAFLVSAGLTPYLVRRISENYRAAKARKAEMEAIVNTKKLVDGREVQTFSSAFYFNRGYQGSKDTRTLVVGQDVYMFSSGVYLDSGKVVGVHPAGAEVRTHQGVLVRFDASGKETDNSRRERLGFGPSPGDRFHNFLWFSAPEFQAWELDDMPFAERTVLIEQQRRDWEAKKHEHNPCS